MYRIVKVIGLDTDISSTATGHIVLIGKKKNTLFFKLKNVMSKTLPKCVKYFGFSILQFLRGTLSNYSTKSRSQNSLFQPHPVF